MLSKLHSDKAAGPDVIGPNVFKELRGEISPIIHSLFEKSLVTGQIPSDWKKANISPIFKKGDKCNPANYRPISFTSCLFVLLLYVPSQQLWSWQDGQLT